MRLTYDVNRSGKKAELVNPNPGLSGIIPADPAADDLEYYAIMITANGNLVSADPVPGDLTAGVRFGDPITEGTVTYVMLCPSVADQQLGGTSPESGPLGDAFYGMVRCGKVQMICTVLGVSESFMKGSTRMVTMNFVMGTNSMFAPNVYPPSDAYPAHANVRYLDYSDLFNHDLVLYPDVDTSSVGDPSVKRQWVCGLSEAPTTAPICSTIGIIDGPEDSTNWFAAILPTGGVQPDPLTMNIIGTAVGIYPSAEGSAQYNGQLSIMQPLAIEFPAKTFYWLCIGHKAAQVRSEVYLAKMGDPVRILAAVATGVCGIAVGPTVLGQ